MKPPAPAAASVKDLCVRSSFRCPSASVDGRGGAARDRDDVRGEGGPADVTYQAVTYQAPTWFLTW